MNPNENGNTPVDPNTDDLDAFNSLLNNKVPEATETEDVPPADDSETDEALATDDEESNEDDEQLVEDDPDKDSLLNVPKPKLTARERIEQLNARYREEERARIEVERQLAELREKQNNPATNTPAAATNEPKGPTPDDLKEDGTAKYELGEFDPQFVSDLADFRVEQRIKSYEEDRTRKEQEAQLTEAENALKAEWQERIKETEQTIPDFRQKAASLEPIFSSTSPEVSEYLAMTIMQLDNGPEVLAYLADNVDEAKRIVSSTAQSATIALGRLDAMIKAPAKVAPKKVTGAPTPPPTNTRGSGGKFDVSPDTDDLEAFERAFYKRK